jgi:uncharacterized protein YceK
VFSSEGTDLLRSIADNRRLGKADNAGHNMDIDGSKGRVQRDDGSVTFVSRLASSTRMRGIVGMLAVCASLAGCASTSDVVATDKPGTYTVAASATGGRMAWARAHEHAVNEAREYCERRGMQSSVTTETVSGVQVMTEHASSVNFECHPRF